MLESKSATFGVAPGISKVSRSDSNTLKNVLTSPREFPTFSVTTHERKHRGEE